MSEKAADGVVIAAATPDQADLRALLDLSDAYMGSLYPAESNHLVDVATLAASNARFLVARGNAGILGCGGLVLGAPGEAEIKRMFVMSDARGLGIGRRILAALEEIARVEGVRVVRLETGVRQPEALGLYRSCGYAERGPFDSYQPDPLSAFFEKRIA